MLLFRLKKVPLIHQIGSIFLLWEKNKFKILYSPDTIKEYIDKLRYFNIPKHKIVEFLEILYTEGIKVNIDFYHHKKYPADQDDIAFILCADNGKATHLVSYDKHLLVLNRQFDFKICRTLEFLTDLRDFLKDND